MKRASASWRMALEIVAIQLAERGVELICPLCGLPIANSELAAIGGTEREHMVAMAYDPAKYDKPWNQRIGHVACCKAKTRGKRTVGSLGGDQSEIARAVRLANGGKKTRGPKIIQSVGFQKPPPRYKRKIPGRRFNGEPIR